MLRQVPWKDHDELVQVHDWLYSDSRSDMQKGVNRILAWKARQYIPTAIESTLQFIQLRLRDCEKLSFSGEELRLTYSMAIVRLVNGSIDPMQNKARPLPVSVMAERINMPGWFVEIRHDATHGYLPSLALLQDAASQALAWIQETFWVPALRTNRKPVMDKGKLQDIEKALEYYRKQCMAAQLKNPKKKNEAPSRIRDNTMKRLVQIISPDDILEGLVPVLLDKGFLIPRDKSKRAVFEDNNISNQLIYLWAPLLEALSEKFDDFGISLMSAMLKRLDSHDGFVMNDKFDYLLSEDSYGSSQEDISQRTYWFKYIINHDFAKEEAIFADVDLDDIVEGCLRSPNYFTRIVLQAVAEIELDDISHSLKPIIDAIGRNLSASSSKTNQNVFDLENDSMKIDMDGELQELNSQLQHIRGQDFDMETSSAWSLYSNTEWTSTPIGCLPGGIMPCLDLPDN
ncbi:Las1-like-domain-containing protein [Phascolomyces articulosus]|uniref:Las1-like-domain-containing protein n=1 Tax=Phascolomyces articulosus TaxID=60185 RepID=A0AAD5PH63_9FUNG|nr:Las1-like-domain-containing protein [Phascolomyces articulosus]